MKKIVVLSGAGISAESGLQTFRAADGLWMGHNIQQVASPEGFAHNHALVQEFYNSRRKEVRKASANSAHIILAELEHDFNVVIVTQNIDDLHERAGSTQVIHLHGEINKMRTEKNPQQFLESPDEIEPFSTGEDGSYLRPHVVWFGEEVPMLQIAAEAMQDADIFLLVGTSLQVYPAAGLIDFVPPAVPKYIVDLVIPEVTRYDNIILIQANATEGLRRFADLIRAEEN